MQHLQLLWLLQLQLLEHQLNVTSEAEVMLRPTGAELDIEHREGGRHATSRPGVRDIRDRRDHGPRRGRGSHGLVQFQLLVFQL